MTSKTSKASGRILILVVVAFSLFLLFALAQGADAQGRSLANRYNTPRTVWATELSPDFIEIYAEQDDYIMIYVVPDWDAIDYVLIWDGHVTADSVTLIEGVEYWDGTDTIGVTIVRDNGAWYNCSTNWYAISDSTVENGTAQWNGSRWVWAKATPGTVAWQNSIAQLVR